MPDTTPEIPPFILQTLSSMANNEFRAAHSTRIPIISSTAEPSMSTMTMADIIATTTTHQPQARRIPSRLEEKLQSLSCDIPPLPTESRLWRGNETHEVMLPITVSKPTIHRLLYLFGITDRQHSVWCKSVRDRTRVEISKRAGFVSENSSVVHVVAFQHTPKLIR